MFIQVGVYKFAKKRVAFRCDYCRHCGRETMSVADRSFNFLHLYWIPILPLGFRTEWRCAVCGQDPHRDTVASRPMKIIVAALLLMIVLTFWYPVFFPVSLPNNSLQIWGLRIGVAVLFIISVRWIGQDSTASLQQELPGVQPYNQSTCPFCHGTLMYEFEGAKCISCDVEHRPLKSKSQDLTFS